jgi:hypothetical protein
MVCADRPGAASPAGAASHSNLGDVREARESVACLIRPVPRLITNTAPNTSHPNPDGLVPRAVTLNPSCGPAARHRFVGRACVSWSGQPSRRDQKRAGSTSALDNSPRSDAVVKLVATRPSIQLLPPSTPTDRLGLPDHLLRTLEDARRTQAEHPGCRGGARDGPTRPPTLW